MERAAIATGWLMQPYLWGLTAGYYFKSFKDMPHVEDKSWKEQQKLWAEGKITLP